MPKRKVSAKAPGSVLRAASYCRTSGKGGRRGKRQGQVDEEMERENTSIPRQKDGNERFIHSNKWTLTRHYVDEAKSGSTEEGRDDFKQLMRDAAAGKFDIVVVFDIKRFSRDGADILRNSNFLRSMLGIHVVDTKNQFDTRDRRKTLINYVHAGVSEQERLDIMERMVGGRIRRAQDGLPWASNRPFGRDFRSTGKNQGEWYVTERGEAMREMLTRYADGEPLAELVKEYGFSKPAIVLNTFRFAKLSGPYIVSFNAPDIDVVNLEVPIPGMPEVISVALEKRVRSRMEHNRTWNKECLRKYLLSGYVFCERCGRALTSANTKGHPYYRHHHFAGRRAGECGFNSIQGKVLDAHALDYLFGFYLDKPAFEAAIKQSLPTSDDRDALEKDIAKSRRQLSEVQREIDRIVSAISKGADVDLLLAKQNELKACKTARESRLDELTESLAEMPDPDQIERQATMLRLQLIQNHTGQDWRAMPFDDVRRFLRSLFGDNTKKSGQGIFVRRDGKKWTVTFQGNLAFRHEVVNGRPVADVLKTASKRLSAEIRQVYREAVADAQRFSAEGVKPHTTESSAKCAGGLREPL